MKLLKEIKKETPFDLSEGVSFWCTRKRFRQKFFTETALILYSD